MTADPCASCDFRDPREPCCMVPGAEDVALFIDEVPGVFGEES